MTTAAKSSGRVARSTPLEALPTGVLTELTTTASRIDHLGVHGRHCNRNDTIFDAVTTEKSQHAGATLPWFI
jgi:hypothetical protein